MIVLKAILLAMQSAQSAPATPPSPPPACAEEGHDAFDFWIGQWEVYLARGGNKIADSLVERVSSGCVVRETWMPLSGRGGTNMSFINHRSGRWEQLWVGSDGKRVDFVGGIAEGEMVLSGYWDGVGPDGGDRLIRMTYSLLEDGSVRQHGEASTDHGNSWQTSFDLIYRRKD